MRWINWLAFGAITLGLAACGADGGGVADGIASLGGGTTTTAGAGASGGGGALTGDGEGDDRFYKFAACMRGKGVDIPDPEAGGGPVRVERGKGMAVEDPKFQEAQKECGKELGDMGPGNMDPAKRQEFQDKALAFAKCMREQGIDMPDPTFGDGGMIQQRIEGDVSPDAPKFQEAQKACESLMPMPPGGGVRVEARG
jgi:hypothetical protein